MEKEQKKKFITDHVSDTYNSTKNDISHSLINRVAVQVLSFTTNLCCR